MQQLATPRGPCSTRVHGLLEITENGVPLEVLPTSHAGCAVAARVARMSAGNGVAVYRAFLARRAWVNVCRLSMAKAGGFDPFSCPSRAVREQVASPPVATHTLNLAAGPRRARHSQSHTAPTPHRRRRLPNCQELCLLTRQCATLWGVHAYLAGAATPLGCSFMDTNFQTGQPDCVPPGALAKGSGKCAVLKLLGSNRRNMACALCVRLPVGS